MASSFVYGAQQRGEDGQTTRAEQKLAPGFETLKSVFNNQLISMQYSDFTLVCKERRYSLHKVIVCPRCYVFAAMLGSKSKGWPESTIDLSEQDADAVHFMIRYFYGFDALTNDTTAEDAGTHALVHPLVLYAKVYILANCYDIRDLRDEALRNFDTAKQTAWDADAFVQAAKLAYFETEEDADIRKSIVDGFMEHREIMRDDNLRSSLVEDTSGLMYDVAQSFASGSRANDLAITANSGSGKAPRIPKSLW